MQADAATLAEVLRGLPPCAHYRIAFSGGMDSHVLLHLFAQLAHRGQVKVSAVHINHGLSANADQWQEHCRQVCEDLAIALQVLKVRVNADAGLGLEAAARHARYQALADIMEAEDMIVTAHHQDDQVETFFLQALRGSGVAGLAAMPAARAFGRGWLGRPLLAFSRAQLLDYARQHALHWIEDESNENISLHRNYLRHEVLPLLKARWPQLGSAVGRVVSHQAEARDLLQQLAQQDMAEVSEDGGETLMVPALLRLQASRQANLLRYWIRQGGYRLPNTRRLQEILRQLAAARVDGALCIRWDQVQLRRYRDRLYRVPVLPAANLPGALTWDLSLPLVIPGVGTLRARQLTSADTPLLALTHRRLSVRFRQGGERCRPVGQPHHHALKKLWQDGAIPPWIRARTPLLYVGDELALVAGQWLCEGFQNDEGEPGWLIEYQAQTSLDC